MTHFAMMAGRKRPATIPNTDDRQNESVKAQLKSASSSHNGERAPYYSTNRQTGFGAKNVGSKVRLADFDNLELKRRSVKSCGVHRQFA